MIRYKFKKGSDPYVDILDTYGVRVESSQGVVSKPAYKSIALCDWSYLHGELPVLKTRRYQSKSITLSCWIVSESKQKAFEKFHDFANFMTSDNLMMMKVTWDGNDGHGTITPDPHAAKGIFNMVYLAEIGEVDYKFRFGRQIAKFKVTLIDPYPEKQVFVLQGTSGAGANYSIASETEMDIYTEGGQSVLDITTATGDIQCAIGEHILLCGDLAHAATDHISGKFFDANDNEDTVIEIYKEI